MVDKDEIYNGILDLEREVSNKLENSFFRERLTDQPILLDCSGKNFAILYERFKYDEEKFSQIVEDWKDYLKILKAIIYERELMDCSDGTRYEKACKSIDKLWARLREINSRIKSLLGKDYLDPEVLIEEKNQKRRSELKEDCQKKGGKGDPLDFFKT